MSQDKKDEKEIELEGVLCEEPSETPLQGAESPIENDESQPIELELLQHQYDELNDKYLRILAEFDNFRKRTLREKEELYSVAQAATIEKFLPVWDNFQRAAAFDPQSEDFAKGIVMIGNNFGDTLKGLGLEAFGEVGDAFDPNIHHAVSHIEDEGLGENVVSQVMQLGYRLGSRVIRVAMVQTAN